MSDYINDKGWTWQSTGMQLIDLQEFMKSNIQIFFSFILLIVISSCSITKNDKNV